MAPNEYNLYTTKRAARQEAWHGPGIEWNPFSKTTRRSSTFPAQVHDVDSVARLLAWDGPHVPNITWDSVPMTTRGSSSFPAQVRDDSVSGREPKVVDAVTRPKIERIKLEVDRESILQDTNYFNRNNGKPQNVEELYWDPIGELSNFEVGELSVSANYSTNIRTRSRKEVLPIDMHVLEFERSGEIFKIILNDTEELSEYLEQTPIEKRPTVVYLLQDISIHASPIVSRLLGCSIDVFRDHFKRASDDVAFMLPSESSKQNHVVIPYQRYYRRSSAKSFCETQNKRSTFCHGNLVSSEEHVTVWTSQTSEDHSTSLIICDADPKQCGDCFGISQTMRLRIENKLQENYQNSVNERLQRNAIRKATWIVLRIASSEWQAVIREQEAYMLPGLKPQYLATTEVRLSEKESFEEYLKQTWSMLKMNVRVIDSLNDINKPLDRREHNGRLKDYQFLEDKVIIQMKQNSASIPLLAAMIAVEESRKAIQQANDVKALTVLATVYVPLSFVAGVFGMNVKELNSGIDVDIWLYFAISVPVTIASMVLVWNWEWLIRKVKNFSIRPNNNSSPRNTVSEALFSMGKMTAGIGKPRDVQIGHDLEK
ncbi:hypothetical protein BOTCAL_0446g00100 [Botryotinia calthae]|uniref:Uncharacterized protein n=1 Tax=Botryotinia calthae TaxID=38488 RepID=A0A4Y8CQU3_9HELO|nr:hypothetical protein BOTCAL_0446g00100 [Botryotinia calthae]